MTDKEIIDTLGEISDELDRKGLALDYHLASALASIAFQIIRAKRQFEQVINATPDAE